MPETSVAHGDLALESDGFLVIGVDGDGAQRVLARLAAVTSVEKDFAEQDVPSISLDPRRWPSSALRSRLPDRCDED